MLFCKKNCLIIQKKRNLQFLKVKNGADYIMSFYLVLCGTNYNLKKWRKLPNKFSNVA
jgi:hypothetical protein